MIIKVSDYISDFFVKKKMFHIFDITGGGAMHLNDSFGKNIYKLNEINLAIQDVRAGKVIRPLIKM